MIGIFSCSSAVRFLGGYLVSCLFLAVASSQEDWVKPLDSFFSDHCFECHDDATEKGGLNLLDLGTDLGDAELMRKWVLVHDLVASGEMPPEKKERPSGDAQKAFLSHLATELFETDVARAEVVLRRLNRVEYENTLRDLFEVPFLDLRHRLPEDAKSHGFDTIGEALNLSTEQMLVYLEAADYVLDEVLGPEEKPETLTSTSNLKDSTERVLGKLFREHEEGVVMFSSAYSPSNYRGFEINEPGTYRFTLRARPFQSDEKMTVRVYAGDVIANRRDRWLVGHYELAPGDEWTEITFEERLMPRDTVKIMTYRNGGHENNADTTERSGVLVGDATCVGPLIDHWPPRSRTKLLGDVDPESAGAEEAVAILNRFLPHFYRRTVSPDECEPFAALTRRALEEGRPWLEALRIGMKAMMVSPEFLFLEEPGRETVGEFAIASRLSYFLWKTMPDAELLSLAARGELSKPEILRAQVERMLEDERAERFVEDFTGQWLDLHEIDFTEPDKNLFPEYDELIRAGMIAETQGFFREVLEENLPTTDFVDADWTILNSRLAEHYGIPGVDGLEYRRVSLPEDSPRGGVISQAAVLKVTANGTNTSPVLRGIWMLENILGEPVPPPPANVPAVEPDITGATSLREMLEKHSGTESCSGCHEKIDPAGFALERFDPIGGWRDWYRSMGEGERVLPDRFIDPPVNKVRVRYKKGLPVDASGETEEGFVFSDFGELKAHLASDPAMITRTVSEKLLAYGLGRGMGFADRPVLEEIVRQAAEHDYGFRDLIHEIVQSSAFREP